MVVYLRPCNQVKLDQLLFAKGLAHGLDQATGFLHL